MALTPVEIRHIKLSRSLFGYTRSAVDELLDDIVESFEQVWRERADLADKIERVEEDLVRYRELETLLRTTLVSAERASQDLKEQARRETQITLDEAHADRLRRHLLGVAQRPEDQVAREHRQQQEARQDARQESVKRRTQDADGRKESVAT